MYALQPSLAIDGKLGASSAATAEIFVRIPEHLDVRWQGSPPNETRSAFAQPLVRGNLGATFKEGRALPTSDYSIIRSVSRNSVTIVIVPN